MDLKRGVILRELCCCAVLVVGGGTFCDGSETAESDSVYYLDAKRTRIIQRIEPTDRLEEGCKFVQVEVVKVFNPKRYALTFEVGYRVRKEDETLLGTFSLFPPDNPGKFIVPSKGRVKDQGEIVLSLVIADRMEPNDSIQVGVKRMTFLNE